MSKCLPTDLFKLQVSCDEPDALIRIFDGYGRPVSQPTPPPIDNELTSGLYELQVVYAGMLKTKLIHLDHNVTDTVSSPQITTAAPLYNRMNFEASDVSRLNNALKQRNGPSGLVIARRACSTIPAADQGVHHFLRLLDHDGHLIKKFSGREVVVSMTPGLYRLTSQDSPSGCQREMIVPIFPNNWTMVFMLGIAQPYLRSASILTIPPSSEFNPSDPILKAADLVLDLIRRGIIHLPNSIETVFKNPNLHDPMLLLGGLQLLQSIEIEHRPVDVEQLMDWLLGLCGDCAPLLTMVNSLAPRATDVRTMEPTLFLTATHRLIGTCFEGKLSPPSGGLLIPIAPALLNDSHWSTWNPDSVLKDDNVDEVSLTPFEAHLAECISKLKNVEVQGVIDIAKIFHVPRGSVLMASRRLIALAARFDTKGNKEAPLIIDSLKYVADKNENNIRKFWEEVFDSYQTRLDHLGPIIDLLINRRQPEDIDIMRALAYPLIHNEIGIRLKTQCFIKPSYSIDSQIFFLRLFSIKDPANSLHVIRIDEDEKWKWFHEIWESSANGEKIKEDIVARDQKWDELTPSELIEELS